MERTGSEIRPAEKKSDLRSSFRVRRDVNSRRIPNLGLSCVEGGGGKSRRKRELLSDH